MDEASECSLKKPQSNDAHHDTDQSAAATTGPAAAAISDSVHTSGSARGTKRRHDAIDKESESSKHVETSNTQAEAFVQRGNEISHDSQGTASPSSLIASQSTAVIAAAYHAIQDKVRGSEQVPTLPKEPASVLGIASPKLPKYNRHQVLPGLQIQQSSQDSDSREPPPETSTQPLCIPQKDDDSPVSTISYPPRSRSPTSRLDPSQRTADANGGGASATGNAAETGAQLPKGASSSTETTNSQLSASQREVDNGRKAEATNPEDGVLSGLQGEKQSGSPKAKDDESGGSEAMDISSGPEPSSSSPPPVQAEEEDQGRGDGAV